MVQYSLEFSIHLGILSPYRKFIFSFVQCSNDD